MTTNLGAASEPPYFFRHSGACIVAGSALCLEDDLQAAKSLFGPKTPLIAVNGASREVKAFALFTYHPSQYTKEPWMWISRQRELFGPDFTVHAARPAKEVDYVWKSIQGSNGSSAWGARKLASMMGFSTVVLCGCPMIPGPYAGYRLGHHMMEQAVVDQLLREIESDTDWHEGCYSMSGRTRDLFGVPDNSLRSLKRT